MASQQYAKNYLGSNLRLLSTAYALSTAEIAGRLGINEQRILRLKQDRGFYKAHKLEELLALADLFNTDLETLVRADLVGELKTRVKKK